jgi:hypothetical protein
MSQIPPPNPYEGFAYEPTYHEVSVNAAAQINGPSIALMVMAGLGGGIQLLSLAVNLLGVGLGAVDAGGGAGPTDALFMGGIAIVSSGIGIVVAGVIMYGAIKMRSLESYSLSMVSTILAMVPCTSPCCLIGIPIGVWALVILNRPEVKAAFRS